MIKFIKNINFLNGFIATILFCPIFFNKTFFDGFQSYKVICFTFFAIVMALLFIIWNKFWLEKKNRLDKTVCIILIVTIIQILYFLRLDIDLRKDISFISDIMLVVFFFILIKLVRNERFQFFLIMVSTVLLILCLLIGIFQSLNLLSPYSANFKITGPYLNPGPYACLVAILLNIPLTILLIEEGVEKYKKFTLFGSNFNVLLVGLVVFGFLIILLTNIRTALVTVIIVGSTILINNRMASKKRFLRITLAVSILCIFFTASLAFLYKKKSSSGRLFIWTTTLAHDAEPSLFGKGYKYFEQKYNLRQAIYFNENNDPNSEASKLAGNVTYAYNEFIEIYINYGLFGLVSFLLLMGVVIKKYYQNYISNSVFTHISFYIILGFFIEMMISYPFSMLGNKIVFITALGMFFGNVKTIELNIPISRIFINSFRVLMFFFLAFAMNVLLRSYFAYSAWTSADLLYKRSGHHQGVIKILEEHKSVFLTNGKFLTYYGKILFLNRDYKKSLEVLTRAKKYSSDPIIYYTAAQCYSILSLDELAIQNYYIAINITPNLLYPRYLLFQHQVKNSLHKEAVQNAKLILSIEEKVLSPATIEIKKIVKDYLLSSVKI